MSKSSVRIVGDLLRGNCKYNSSGSFISTDGSAMIFADSGQQSELGEKIQYTLVSHLNSLLSDLHIEKREFLWHPNDKTKAQIYQRITSAFSEAICCINEENNWSDSNLIEQISLFMAVEVGETLFAGNFGKGQFRVLKENSMDLANPVLTFEIHSRASKKVELFDFKLTDEEKVLFSYGSVFNHADVLSSVLKDDYRSIIEIIKKCREKYSEKSGAFYLIGLDKPYHAAVERGFKEVAETLSKSTLFRDLEKDEISALLILAERRLFSPGQVIYEEGSDGISILVLVSGTIGIIINDKEQFIRNISGETFGESAFLEGLPRSATLIAKTEVILFEMINDHLWDLLSNKPSLGMKILTRIASNTSRKMREASAEVDRLKGNQITYKKDLSLRTQFDKMTPHESRQWVQNCSKALRESYIFSAMKNDEMIFMVGKSKPHLFRQGAIMAKENEVSNSVYLGLSGKIRIFIAGKKPEIFDALGHVIGETGFIVPIPFEQTIHALTDVEAIEIPNEIMINLIQKYPNIGNKILWSISRHFIERINDSIKSRSPIVRSAIKRKV